MALINNAPPPLGDPIAQQTRKEFKPGEDPQAGLCSQPWGDWFTNLMSVQSKAAAVIKTESVIDSIDSITPPVDFSGGNITTGRYRVSYFMLITVGGGVSVPLDLTIAWTYRTVARSTIFSIPDATLAGSHIEGTFLIAADNLSQITYETSNPAAARYDLFLVLEEIDA